MMGWTREKPTVPGWYWLKYGGDVRVCKVHAVTPCLLRVETSSGWFSDVDLIDGEWSTHPLEPPKGEHG